MLRVFQITLFIFLPFAFNAQAPGYHGKRFVLGYGGHFSPAIFNTNAFNKTILGFDEASSAEKGKIAFNYSHEIYIEYTLKTRFMFGLSSKFYKTNYDNSENVEANGYVNGGDVKGFYRILGQSFSLYGKFYKKKYVAPWGKYKILGLVLNLYNTIYNPSIMNVEIKRDMKQDTLISNFGEQKQNFKGVNILLGYGRSRIIKNHITLDYGITIQLFSILPTTYRALTGYSLNPSENNKSNYIKNTAGKRI